VSALSLWPLYLCQDDVTEGALTRVFARLDGRSATITILAPPDAVCCLQFERSPIFLRREFPNGGFPLARRLISRFSAPRKRSKTYLEQTSNRAQVTTTKTGSDKRNVRLEVISAGGVLPHRL